ncbi:MAG: hypothetical protein KIT14_19760 [bacterium]|nr:hypothetical protein [bacterium]
MSRACVLMLTTIAAVGLLVRPARAAECALRVHVTPPTRTTRAVAHACGAGCEFSLQVCRARAGDGCPGDVVSRVRLTSYPDAALAAAVTPPPADTACGPPAAIVVPPETRTRFRAVALDACDRPLDRDQLLLECLPDGGWLGCVPVTTTSTTRPAATTSTLPSGGCLVSGCNAEVCAEAPVASACVWTPAFACYRSATCARQPDGACGWTPAPALGECLRQHEG